MSVRQLVNVNIAVTAVLASTLSGIGAANVAIPLCALAAAGLSLWLTDFTQRFYVGRWTVNSALVLVAAVTAVRFARTEAIGDLPVLADAFAYVQIVMLFEKKTTRTWWDLLSLGFIQVVFAGLQDHGPLFGLLLCGYLFFGLSTLSLMFLHREQTSTGQRNDRNEASDAPRASAVGHWARWARLGKVVLGTMFVGPLSLYLRFHERSPDRYNADKATATGPPSKRWPWLREQPTLEGSASVAPEQPGVGREFWYRMGQMAVVSVMVSLVVFFIVPRFGGIDASVLRYGSAAWARGAFAIRRTGYSNHVTLGELGTLLNDSEPVLEAEFADYETNEPYQVQEDVYFRGGVLTYYRRGQWEHRRSGADLRLGHLPSVENPGEVDLVRQRIAIEPMQRSDVFCVWPLVFVQKNDHLGFNTHSERMGRSRDARSRRYVYELGTTAFVDGIQADLAPCEVQTASVLLEWPSGSLTRLAAKAQQWVSESAIPADDPIGRARHLETRLRDSGQFGYSAEEPDRDSGLDPIEDFVTLHPEGNCEFFASALTLMLRSQGIPARMVIGFKTDEYSVLNQVHIARNSHSHTWVEAYIAPDQLGEPPRRDDPLCDWSRGAWLRLDPTPGGSEIGSDSGRLARGFGYYLGKLRSFWRRHVTGMSGTQQRAALYEPLTARVKGIGLRLVSPEWWSGVALSAIAAIRNMPEETFGRYGWRGIVACLALLIVAATALGRWHGWSRGRKSRMANNGSRPGRNGRQEVRFYRQLEALLGRHGLTRAASQTHREFARDSGIKLSESTGELHVAALPLQVVSAFYQVRFGESDLNDTELAAVGQALRRIEQAARKKREA